MNARYLSLILLLLLAAVPLASAGGMAKVYLSPAEASWKTGQTVQVKVMYDNNLKPLARDISLYFDWNAEMLRYEKCDFKVGNSTIAGLHSSHELNLMVGDFTSGYKNGDYPLAVLTFRVIGPGETPIQIRVARLNDMDGKPVKFVAGTNLYSIAGDKVANPGTAATVAQPTVPAAGQPTVIVVTPPATYTLIPTLPQAVNPQVPVQLPPVLPTTYPTVQQARTYPTAYMPAGAVAPAWPALTPGAALPTQPPTTLATMQVVTPIPTTEVATAMPTTIATTVPTTLPTLIFTTEQTTVTTVPTTEETTVTTTAPLGRQITVSAPIAPVGIPITDTPEENQTPNMTPTVERTLPSPLANETTLTEEPTEEWPLEVTSTQTPTLFPRRTLTAAPVNNSSAALAPAGSSLLGDAGIFLVAAIVGVALVALGVVFLRRNRDDWL